MAHSWNASIREVAVGSEVPGHPQLYSELETGLGYMRPCLKKQRGKNKRKERKSGRKENNLTFVFTINVTYVALEGNIQFCRLLLFFVGLCFGFVF